ncbi:MAG: hypothetical protein FWE98_01315 [Oscillospiraceae bacterium]|nr:hypothetical protein [Oscillospiraceae bacterium]
MFPIPIKTFVGLAIILAAALGLFFYGKQEPEERKRVTLYLPDLDSPGGYGFFKKVLELHMPKLVSLQAAELVSQLAYEGALPEGCAALRFYVSTSELDMNAAFAEALGRAPDETLLMGSLVNTMLDFFALDGITITAEGEALRIGHIACDKPFTFYENS